MGDANDGSATAAVCRPHTARGMGRTFRFRSMSSCVFTFWTFSLICQKTKKFQRPERTSDGQRPRLKPRNRYAQDSKSKILDSSTFWMVRSLTTSSIMLLVWGSERASNASCISMNFLFAVSGSSLLLSGWSLVKQLGQLLSKEQRGSKSRTVHLLES